MKTLHARLVTVLSDCFGKEPFQATEGVACLLATKWIATDKKATELMAQLKTAELIDLNGNKQIYITTKGHSGAVVQRAKTGPKKKPKPKPRLVSTREGFVPTKNEEKVHDTLNAVRFILGDKYSSWIRSALISISKILLPAFSPPHAKRVTSNVLPSILLQQGIKLNNKDDGELYGWLKRLKNMAGNEYEYMLNVSLLQAAQNDLRQRIGR